MANYIQLIDKATDKAVPFAEIDRLLCDALGQPCDEEKYLCDWYDTIGWRSVSGDSLATIAAALLEEGYHQIAACLQWIDQHYTLNQWHGH